MYKKILCCLLAFALVLVSGGDKLILSVGADLITDVGIGGSETITTMPDFTDDAVMVVLTHEASLQFINYTPADFPEIECAEIEDLSTGKGAKVQAVLRGEQLEMDSIGARFMNQNIDVDGFRRILYLKLTNPGKGNVLRAVAALEQREDVYSAEPDYVIQPMAVVLPDLPSTDYAWGANKIQLDDAWEIETGSSGVLVGVVDTGIDVEHPDLKDRVDGQLSKDFTGTSNNDYTDEDGHGTHVAGIIGALGVADNFVRGVCQDVTLVSLRVLREGYTTSRSTIANAINYAECKNISILNLSLNAVEPGTYALQTAIDNFSGVLVCALGNDNINTDNGGGCAPAVWNYDNIISVGASTQNDTKWTYSNYGMTTLDIFAPGDNIVSCYPRDLCASSNCSNEGHMSFGYHTFSGTSMAAPFVTGVVALIVSMHPNISPAAIRSVLINSVDSVIAFSDICESDGRLNAYNALSSRLFHNTVSYLRANDSQHWVHCATCDYSSLEDHIIHPSLGTCMLCNGSM